VDQPAGDTLEVFAEKNKLLDHLGDPLDTETAFHDSDRVRRQSAATGVSLGGTTTEAYSPRLLPVDLFGVLRGYRAVFHPFGDGGSCGDEY